MDHLAFLKLPAFDQISPAEARQQYREARGALRPPAPGLTAVRDLVAAVDAGSAFGVPLSSVRRPDTAEESGTPEADPAESGLREIGLRLYRPGDGVRPALIYFHGGGWVVGDLDTHDVVCRQIAAQSGVIVIAVDYRLAPEHRFPAAVEDAWSATTWIAAHSSELGIDASRIAIGGDSAGGGLAAAVTLMARDAGAPALAYQVLVYPVMDLRSESESYTTYAEGCMLTRSAMKWYIAQYAPDAASWHDWRGSPLLAESVDGVPPALILAAQCDPLVAEGAQYARRLEQAGVPVEYVEYEGMVHGFLTMGGKIDTANKAVSMMARSISALRTQP